MSDVLQYLDADGRVVRPLPTATGAPAALIEWHRAMSLARAFDARAIALQRTGQLGTFASALGQEAVGVGVASAMREDDVLVPSYRDHPAQFWRGTSMVEVLLYWGGDERGNDFARARHDFPNCVPIGTQTTQAAGAAYALARRGRGQVAVCLLGDGATSRGDFAEALNFAGVFRVPVVFVISNNQWAISTPRIRQCAAPTLAQKAGAAGLPGVSVDGNDVIAVHQATREALDRARAGDGATVIEAITYRLADHTTADDATRYRDPAEVAAHWKREPIARLRTHLAGVQAWDADAEITLARECATAVDAAVSAYRAIVPPDVGAMFDCLFETLPPALAAQRAEALSLRSGG